MASEDLTDAIAASPVQGRQIAQMMPLISGPLVPQRRGSTNTAVSNHTQPLRTSASSGPSNVHSVSQPSHPRPVADDQSGMLRAASITQAQPAERVPMLLKMELHEREAAMRWMAREDLCEAIFASQKAGDRIAPMLRGLPVQISKGELCFYSKL